MSKYWQRVRAFRPDLWRLFMSAGLVLTAWLGLMAVLYNLYLLRLGFDARAIGLLAGLGALVWGLAALPAGLLSNRIGLRNSIVAGVGMYGLGISLTLIVESVPHAHWQAWLLGSQVVMNIGIAFATVNAAPYIMAMSSDYERPHAFAFLATLNPVAALFGSVLAGVLPSLLSGWLGVGLEAPDPYRLALWAAPILCLLSVLPLLGADRGAVITGTGTAVTDPSQSGDSPEATAGTPLGLLAFWALVVFLAAAGEGTVRSFFNVLLDTTLEVPTATIGLTMGAAQLLPILVALPLPLMLTRWGPGYTLLGGIVALAACLVPLALGSQLGMQAGSPAVLAAWLIGAAYLATVATLAVIRASRNMFGQQIVSPRWRTSSQGAAMLGLAFGLSAAGVVGGTLIEVFGFGALFFAGAAAALAAAGLLLGYLLRAARRRAGQTLSAPAGALSEP
jgi:hypothetical protein